MQLQRLGLLVVLFQIASALHFYTSPHETKCFFEELPKGTVVVAKLNSEIGQQDQFDSNPLLKLEITVDETFDNNHRVVNQKSPSNGEFTFSASDSGEHRFCITPRFPQKDVSVRVFFDLAIAGAEVIDSRGKDEVSLLKNKVKEMNNKLKEIQSEQLLMREREANFRDQSEETNSKVVRWSLIQLLVLGATGYFQLRHLKQFFIKQKVL